MQIAYFKPSLNISKLKLTPHSFSYLIFRNRQASASDFRDILLRYRSSNFVITFFRPVTASFQHQQFHTLHFNSRLSIDCSQFFLATMYVDYPAFDKSNATHFFLSCELNIKPISQLRISRNILLSKTLWSINSP